MTRPTETAPMTAAELLADAATLRDAAATFQDYERNVAARQLRDVAGRLDAEARRLSRPVTIGEFTKDTASDAQRVVDRMFDALHRSKRGDFILGFNTVAQFIAAAKTAAPEAQYVG